MQSCPSAHSKTCGSQGMHQMPENCTCTTCHVDALAITTGYRLSLAAGQERQATADGTSPNLEPFYTAASALPEYQRPNSIDGLSMADMDAAFAEELESNPRDTYLPGRGTADKGAGRGGGLADILEAGEEAPFEVKHRVPHDGGCVVTGTCTRRCCLLIASQGLHLPLLHQQSLLALHICRPCLLVVVPSLTSSFMCRCRGGGTMATLPAPSRRVRARLPPPMPAPAAGCPGTCCSCRHLMRCTWLSGWLVMPGCRLDWGGRGGLRHAVCLLCSCETGARPCRHDSHHVWAVRRLTLLYSLRWVLLHSCQEACQKLQHSHSVHRPRQPDQFLMPDSSRAVDLLCRYVQSTDPCVCRRASGSPADEFAQNLRRQRSQVEQEIVALSAETDPNTLRYKLVGCLTYLTSHQGGPWLRLDLPPSAILPVGSFARLQWHAIPVAHHHLSGPAHHLSTLTNTCGMSLGHLAWRRWECHPVCMHSIL